MADATILERRITEMKRGILTTNTPPTTRQGVTGAEITEMVEAMSRYMGDIVNILTRVGPIKEPVIVFQTAPDGSNQFDTFYVGSQGKLYGIVSDLEGPFPEEHPIVPEQLADTIVRSSFYDEALARQYSH